VPLTYNVSVFLVTLNETTTHNRGTNEVPLHSRAVALGFCWIQRPFRSFQLSVGFCALSGYLSSIRTHVHRSQLPHIQAITEGKVVQTFRRRRTAANIPLQPTVKKLRFLPSAELAR